MIDLLTEWGCKVWQEGVRTCAALPSGFEVKKVDVEIVVRAIGLKLCEELSIMLYSNYDGERDMFGWYTAHDGCDSDFEDEIECIADAIARNKVA